MRKQYFFNNRNMSGYSLISHQLYTDFLKCSLKLVPNSALHEAKPATHVFELARTERSFLKAIYKQLSVQADCAYIPYYKDIGQRHIKTLEALNRNCEFIFNACIVCNNKLAKIDLLRRVEEESDSKPAYQVVIVTESDEITREHLVELHWNCAIASGFVEKVSRSVGFLNRELAIKEISLNESKNFYENLVANADAAVMAFANNSLPDGAEFSTWCYSCHKRYSCIPSIIENKPASLLTAVTPSRSRYLKEKNIHNIDMLNSLSDEALMELNFDVFDIRNIREQCRRIANSQAVFTQQIKKEYFADVVFVSLQLARHNEVLYPRKILFKKESEILEIVLHYDADTKSIGIDAGEMVRFNELFHEKILAHGLDAVWLKRISAAHAMRNVRIVDLAEFVAQYVHMPLYGLELGELKLLLKQHSVPNNSFVKGNSKSMSAYERLQCVEELVNYFVKHMY